MRDYHSSSSEAESTDIDNELYSATSELEDDAVDVLQDGQAAVPVKRRPKHAGFMEAMGKLLAEKAQSSAQLQQNEQQLVAGDEPILSKSKSIERRIDEQTTLDRARRLFNHEQRKRMRQDHISIADYHPDREKRLKNVATRGVVQLFNAFQQQQKAKHQLKHSGRRVRKAEELATTKTAFMQYLNKGAAADTKEIDDKIVKSSNASSQGSSGASWIRKDFIDPSLKDWDTVGNANELDEDLLVTE